MAAARVFKARFQIATAQQILDGERYFREC